MNLLHLNTVSVTKIEWGNFKLRHLLTAGTLKDILDESYLLILKTISGAHLHYFHLLRKSLPCSYTSLRKHKQTLLKQMLGHIK